MIEIWKILNNLEVVDYLDPNKLMNNIGASIVFIQECCLFIQHLLMVYMIWFGSQVNISLKDSSSEGDTVKKFLYHQGRDEIREKLNEYIVSLKEGM